MTMENARLAPRTSVWVVAIVATLGMSVSYIDRQTLAAIAPSVTKALDIDNAHYGWLLSAFAMAYMVFTPISGVLVDRFGSRRSFAVAILVWSAVAAGHALAGSFAALCSLRVLLGMTESPSFPSAAQTVRRVLPDARRSLAIGLLFTGSSIGAMVAGALAIRLETSFGFRGAFIGSALVGTLWLPLWLVVTRGHGLERPAPKAERGDGDAGWLALVRSPAVLRAFIAVLGSAPTQMFVLSWTSKYLTDRWHVPRTSLPLYLAMAPLVFDVGSVTFGALASRREAKLQGERVTHRGLMLVAGLLTSTLALTPLAGSAEQAILFLALATSGVAGTYALVTADMLGRVPPSRASAAGAMTAASQSLSHIIAGPLLGWTIDRTHGYSVGMVGIGLVIIPTTLIFVAWPGMSSQRVPE